MNTNGSTVTKKFRAFVDKIPPKARGYLKGNWGAPFVVGFIALLLVTAVFSVMNFSVLADEVSVYAYYALVVGVFLQLACFLKYRNNDGESSQ